MGPPRKRASSKTSKGVPITQKKQRTNNSSPNPTAPTEEWIEPNTVLCKTESNTTQVWGVKREPEDQSDPNRINGEVSGLADVPPVQGISLEKYNKIKEEQEEWDISQTQSTNQELGGHSFSAPLKVDLEDQKWMVKDNDENQNVTTGAEEKRVKPYTCFCGKSYTCTSHLNRHHRKTHGSQIQPSGHYNNVIREKKPVERCFTCHCGKQYTRNSNLRRHQNSCSEQAPPPPVTIEHSATYPNVEDQEGKIKPYVCACGKSYTCSSHLYRHQRTHLDSNSQTTRSFICNCGKAYSCSSHLYRHQKTHAEEKAFLGRPVKEDPETLEQTMKPHLCFCGKRYTCSSHLYRHQKAHHVQNLPLRENQEAEDNEMGKRYKCDCGKSYTSSSHLYRHQRTHKNPVLTEEVNDLEHDSEVELEECRQKPYTCECGKSFILSFSLLLHKKIHCRWKHTTDCDPPEH